MQIVISVIITLAVAMFSWQLPSFKWRVMAILFSAFLSSNVAYLFSLWLYPDSQISSWSGIIIDGSFIVALSIGIYIMLIIQIIKVVGARN